MPLINASVSFDQFINPDGTAQDPRIAAQNFFNQGISYVITGKSTHGFSIILNRPATQDIQFSWAAVAVRNVKRSVSAGSVTPTAVPLQSPTPTAAISPTARPTVVPTNQPSSTPTPTTILTPTAFPTESPSPTVPITPSVSPSPTSTP